MSLGAMPARPAVRGLLASVRACQGRTPCGRWRSCSGAAGERKEEAAAPPRTEGRWGAFTESWNDAATRRPLPLVIFFSGVATVNWALIFGTLSWSTYATSALGAPEFAVGWLVMRVTARLRMPVNAAAAAAALAACPGLSSLKVSPLLGVLAGDGEAQAAVDKARKRLEESPSLSGEQQRLVKRCTGALAALGRWAEGPIDKYGLSYYIVSKLTSVSTLCGATLAAMHGLDVPGTLSHWGLSGELQSDAGLFACAAALNVPCAPLHFLGAVGAVRRLEGVASVVYINKQRELEELEALNGSLTEEEQECRDLTEADVQKNFVSNVAYLALFSNLAFAFWSMRRMSSSQAKLAQAAPEGVSPGGEAPSDSSKE